VTEKTLKCTAKEHRRSAGRPEVFSRGADADTAPERREDKSKKPGKQRGGRRKKRRKAESKKGEAERETPGLYKPRNKS
tara:strand:- start:300 stop:536 length:237 start_codon:yes stop_codon:yes gene_type:complete